MLFYSLTIFLSAFLLFLVQLLIARHILPWYGGGPGVWATCMVFFQITLLVGYAYAHGLVARLTPRRQVTVHLLMLAISLPFLVVAPDAAWKPQSGDSPIGSILWLLAAHVGLPFGILSSTSPLLMSWFSKVFPRRHPYRLYALSNFGSFLALISYPFLLAPALPLVYQGHLWSTGYVVFVLSCAVCAIRFGRLDARQSARKKSAQAPAETDAVPSRKDALLWLALSATGSVLLLATTNQVCTDLAVVPLLWVLPLAIYLLSFVICFDREQWYRRELFLPLFAVASSMVTYVVVSGGAFSLTFFIGVYSVALFAGTMICHGELVRIKPVPRYLTRFYLAVSAGGAIGGTCVAILAPLAFNDYWEYPLGAACTGLLAMICVYRSQSKPFRGRFATIAWGAGLLVFVGVTGGLIWDRLDNLSRSLETSRTFFGVIRIRESKLGDESIRKMTHGNTAHGAQMLSEKKQHVPTKYYGWDSGAGLTLRRYRALLETPRPLRVGVIGLGAGTLSTYGQPGDRFRFYEIDPEVERLAREYFSFLSDSEAETEVVIGDARIMLERESAEQTQGFDVLIVDAFNSDSVPMHLLTREALAVYRSHMKPGGVIAFHVSNRFLDLAAVVRGLTEDAGLKSVRIISSGNPYWYTDQARWVVVTDNSKFLNDPQIRGNSNAWMRNEMQPLLWTDDFGSLWSAVTDELATGKWAYAPNSGHFVADRGDLLTLDDALQVEELCRELYLDFAGRYPLMVVTIKSMAETELPPNVTFDQFANSLYDDSLRSTPQNDYGMLIVVSEGDKSATLRMGKSWSTEERKAARRIFLNTAIEGLKNDRTSQGLADSAQQLIDFVRKREQPNNS